MPARKLHPATTTRDDQLFNELFFKMEITNLRNPVISVTTPSTAGAEFSIKHNLGHVPNGYILCGASSDCRLYDGVTASDAQTLYLRATAANVSVKILVF